MTGSPILTSYLPGGIDHWCFIAISPYVHEHVAVPDIGLVSYLEIAFCSQDCSIVSFYQEECFETVVVHWRDTQPTRALGDLDSDVALSIPYSLAIRPGAGTVECVVVIDKKQAGLNRLAFEIVEVLVRVRKDPRTHQSVG